ncbi:hypothetical protein GCM10023228_04570 [Brevibacillus fulvus]
MPAVKPKPNHPWRRSCILRRDVNEFIKQSGTNPWVNNYKIGGGMQPWNGRK